MKATCTQHKFATIIRTSLTSVFLVTDSIEYFLADVARCETFVQLNASLLIVEMCCGSLHIGRGRYANRVRLSKLDIARYKVTIPDKSLGTLAHFRSIYQANLSVPPPSPQFNVVYRGKFVIAGFQHCQGGEGKGVPFSTDVITFVSKTACQCIFMQSDQACQGLLSWIVGVT